jgi:hypothetical protein
MIDKWIDEWMDGWMGGWMDGQIHTCIYCLLKSGVLNCLPVVKLPYLCNRSFCNFWQGNLILLTGDKYREGAIYMS